MRWCILSGFVLGNKKPMRMMTIIEQRRIHDMSQREKKREQIYCHCLDLEKRLGNLNRYIQLSLLSLFFLKKKNKEKQNINTHTHTHIVAHMEIILQTNEYNESLLFYSILFYSKITLMTPPKQVLFFFPLKSPVDSQAFSNILQYSQKSQRQENSVS